MAADQWVLFIAAGVLLNLTPGPDVLFIVAHAVRRGVRAGVVAALGIAAGCCVHVLAAALGVSALLAASGTALALLKWLGALYLVYVGARMLQAALAAQAATVASAVPDSAASPVLQPTRMPQIPQTPQTPQMPLRAVFRRGFLTNVLNPKVALFFLAFVPQFIDPASLQAPLWFLGLGLLFTVNSTVVNTGWALTAAWAARRAGALAHTLRWLDGVAGALFVALGVKLALGDLPGLPGVSGRR